MLKLRVQDNILATGFGNDLELGDFPSAHDGLHGGPPRGMELETHIPLPGPGRENQNLVSRFLKEHGIDRVHQVAAMTVVGKPVGIGPPRGRPAVKPVGIGNPDFDVGRSLSGKAQQCSGILVVGPSSGSTGGPQQ